MDELEFYKELASRLSYLSVEIDFRVDNVGSNYDNANLVVDVEIDGKTITVGPFIRYHTMFDEVLYWQRNPSTDKYVIYANFESVESWGHMYSDEGIEFYVGEITGYAPIIESRNLNIDRPPFIRW